MPADEDPTSSTEEKPRVANWGKFAVSVVKDALWALLVAWVGGTFMFYTYATNLSNGGAANRGKTDVLFNVQLAQTLCELQRISPGADAGAASSEAPAASSAAPSASSAASSAAGGEPMSGGSWPTTYYCPQKGKPVAPATAKKEAECPFPYYWYPGREGT